MAKIYSYDSVKKAASCLDYLSRIGVYVNSAGRCKAVWRGGDGDSVHVEADKWFDFVEKRGGSVIDLCARVEFNGDATQAVTRLGEMFSVDPVAVTKARPKKTRAQILTEQGYANTAVYDYTDEKGAVLYSILRFEKHDADGTRHKEFIHRTPDHEGLDASTQRVPYNLPAVVNSSRVCIVEGEKDVETLRSFGFVATTNSGGASNWDKSLNHWFDGKDVVILPDNDEPGAKHGQLLVDVLKPRAKSVKLITLSAIPKGDVTDWANKEGGTAQKLAEIIAATVEVDAKLSPEIALAKQANQTEFRNFELVGSGKSERKVPRTLPSLIEECHARFLGFPKKLGSVMFDWNRDGRRIEWLHNKETLFSWMNILSGHNVVFESGCEFVSKGEFFEGLALRAAKYDSISAVPHYPMRSDVFYTYGTLPPPDPTHSSFWKLVSFFNPANETQRTLVAAFLAAPIFYEQTATRPIWVIDTEDQQGSGKTSLVKMCAHLYGSEYISIDIDQLNRDIQSVRRRLVSSDARRKRVAVFDNITKTLASANLATTVTDSFITGLAPYGRSEESRPNDLTYVITVNNASLSDDIAIRSYVLRLAKVKRPDPNWETTVFSFIDANRLQILSDVIHMIDNNALASSTVRRSRFGRFDSRVLSAVCRSEEEYRAVDASLKSEADNSNTDADHGVEFLELFRERMRDCTDPNLANRIALRNATMEEMRSVVNPNEAIFITAADVDWMLDNSDGELQKWKSRQILGIVKNRHVHCFDPNVQRVNAKGVCFDGEPLHRYRGFLFRPNPAPGRVSAQVLRRSGKYFSVIARTSFIVGPDETETAQAANAASALWDSPAANVPASKPVNPFMPSETEDVETLIEMESTNGKVL